MPLSADLRHELAQIVPRSECDRRAELAGLFHSAGSIHLLGRGELALHLDLASSAVARRAFSLLRDFDVASEIRTYRQRAFHRATRYQLHVPGLPHALQVLHEAGVLDRRLAPTERPPKRVVARGCCRAAYLRGALLGSGSLSGPRGPHLEVRRAEREGAEFVAALAAEEGAPMQVTQRRGHAAAYAKGADAIAAVLAAAGAGDAVVRLAEASVMGEARARANRLANADHANLVRAGRAAHRQLEAIRKLQADGVLGDLPSPLLEVAALRLRHPSLSLAELGRKCRPPAPKATVHRRLRALERRAE